MAAAESNRSAICDTLLNYGASPNYRDTNGWTCTMEAAEKGHTDLVRHFVQKGADLNAFDKKGWTALMAACEGGSVECVRLLWIHGAEHNLEDKCRWTALDEAKEKGFTKIVEFEPIVEAERNLKKMLETDDWQPQQALQYLDRAQQVWCLKGIVAAAAAKLTEVLQQRVINGKSADREQCFDWLLNYGVQAFGPDTNESSNVISNEQPDNLKPGSNPQLLDAAVDLCRGRLSTAAEGESIAAIKWAMASTVRSGANAKLSTEMNIVKEKYKKLLDVPDSWDIEAMASQLDAEGRMLNIQTVDDATFSYIQGLLNSTFRKRYTRDRRGGIVPDRMKVERAVSVQNSRVYEEYQLKCKTLPARGECPALPTIYTMQAECSSLQELNSEIHEVRLWHGTSQTAAESIAATDFRLNLAGSNAGTLYGSGVYFADSCSKSDEYSQPSADGLRCLILCRVALGRVLYNDEISPDAEQLTRKCLSGEYDSVLGDREKCRGTFKEFIIFDEAQVYPEFLVFYNRVHEIS